MSGIRSIRGPFLAVSLLICGFFAVTLLIFPLSIMHLITFNSLFHELINCVIAEWFSLSVALLELNGIQFRIFTDQNDNNSVNINKYGSTLILSNHPSTADWMYLWSLLMRILNLNQLRIMMKSSLRNVPIIGWSLSSGVHCFMDRKWENDQLHLKRFAEFYHQLKNKNDRINLVNGQNHQDRHDNHNGHNGDLVKRDVDQSDKIKTKLHSSKPLQLLMFPEGTDLNPQGIVSSASFAKKNNLPLTYFTLHPRTTGFQFIVSAVKFDQILDITLAFPDHQTSKINELLQNVWPTELHVFIKCYEGYKIGDSDQTAQWLKDRWNEKENRLSRFYEQKKENKTPQFTDNNGQTIRELSFDEIAINNRLQIELIKWFIFVSCSIFFLICFKWLRYHILLACLVYIVAALKGGIDRYILSR